jgi:hypothetical protein
MTIDEIKKLLDNGDYVKIARLAGLEPGKNSRQYVYKILSGKYKYKSVRGKAKLVVECAEIIAKRNLDNGKTIE